MVLKICYECKQQLVRDGLSRCESCYLARQQRLQAAEKARPTARARGYTAEWSQLAKDILQASPVCVRCQQSPSVLVHHRVKVRDGGSHHPSNLEPLCSPCHQRAHRSIR